MAKQTRYYRGHERFTKRYEVIGGSKLDITSRTLPVSFNIGEPVKRSFGPESLSVGKSFAFTEFMESGRAPVLLDHDLERQIGVVDEMSISHDGDVLNATLRFSRGQLGQDVMQDLDDGLLNTVSLGYEIGRLYEDPRNAGGYIAKWRPLAISIMRNSFEPSQHGRTYFEQSIMPLPEKSFRLNGVPR